jgi:hypothetical protein
VQYVLFAKSISDFWVCSFEALSGEVYSLCEFFKKYAREINLTRKILSVSMQN